MSNEHLILVVDDDVETREALGTLLEAEGYNVALAANGAEGLTKLRNGQRPSLILLDLMMPEKNGFQFRVEQVADPNVAEIPVIVFSGNTEAYADSTILGAVGCLTKPIAPDELLRIVKGYC